MASINLHPLYQISQELPENLEFKIFLYHLEKQDYHEVLLQIRPLMGRGGRTTPTHKVCKPTGIQWLINFACLGAQEFDKFSYFWSPYSHDEGPLALALEESDFSLVGMCPSKHWLMSKYPDKALKRKEQYCAPQSTGSCPSTLKKL